MCSVQGCVSPLRTPRFKLPEDPEVRLEWVQFLAAVNHQRFRESSWTDITVCCEHFRHDCLLYVAPAGSVQLTPGAVPSVPCSSQPQPDRTVPPPAAGGHGAPASPTDPAASNTLVSRTESASGNETDDSIGANAQDSDDGDWDPEPELLSASQREQNRDYNDDSEDEEERFVYSAYSTHCKLCAECGKFFRNRWPHTCEHKTRPFSCNICGKRFANEMSLLHHNRIHADDYVHRCKYCDRTFRVKVEKLAHEQIHLTEGEPYRCPECPETFATSKERLGHLKKDHRDPEDLKCHICGIQFLWALSVQRHMAVHTGLRPYKCPVCQRGFNQAGHLKSHMRLHTGERPFKCQHCDQRFNHNVSLKSHLQRYHTPGAEKKAPPAAKRKRARDKEDQAWNNSETDGVEGQEAGEGAPAGEFKKKRRSTGRPRGRPKSYASDDVVVAIQLKSKTKGGRKRQARKRRRAKREESDEFSDFDSTEERGETRDTVNNNHEDSDSDFDPSRLE